MASFFDQAIDIHHVFPRKWCQDNGIDGARQDSIVNKTPLSYNTNRSIGGRAPSSYLKTIQTQTAFSDEELSSEFSGKRSRLGAASGGRLRRVFRGRTGALFV